MHISKKLSNFLKEAGLKIPTTSDVASLKIVDGKLRFLSSKKFEVLRREATRSQIVRNKGYIKYYQQIKYGKLLQKLYPDIPAHELRELAIKLDSFVEDIAGQLTSTVVDLFEIKPPTVAYNSTNYDTSNGTVLAKSCLNNKPSTSFFEALGLQVLTLKSERYPGRIRGRALLWENGIMLSPKTHDIIEDSHIKVMDRIYYSTEHNIETFLSYARVNNYHVKTQQDAGCTQLYTPEGLYTAGIPGVLVDIDTGVEAIRKGRPYLDTFYRIYIHYEKKHILFTPMMLDTRKWIKLGDLRDTGNKLRNINYSQNIVAFCSKCKRMVAPNKSTIEFNGEHYCPDCTVKDYTGKYIPTELSTAINRGEDTLYVKTTELIRYKGDYYLPTECVTAVGINAAGTEFVEAERIPKDIAHYCEEHKIYYVTSECPHCVYETHTCPHCNTTSLVKEGVYTTCSNCIPFTTEIVNTNRIIKENTTKLDMIVPADITKEDLGKLLLDYTIEETDDGLLLVIHSQRFICGMNQALPLGLGILVRTERNLVFVASGSGSPELEIQNRSLTKVYLKGRFGSSNTIKVPANVREQLIEALEGYKSLLASKILSGGKSVKLFNT